MTADGTGFKKQPGERPVCVRRTCRGEARLVMEVEENGAIQPIGVWAELSWKAISNEVKQRTKRGNKRP